MPAPRDMPLTSTPASRPAASSRASSSRALSTSARAFSRRLRLRSRRLRISARRRFLRPSFSTVSGSLTEAAERFKIEACSIGPSILTVCHASRAPGPAGLSPGPGALREGRPAMASTDEQLHKLIEEQDAKARESLARALEYGGLPTEQEAKEAWEMLNVAFDEIEALLWRIKPITEAGELAADELPVEITLEHIGVLTALARDIPHPA